jgi:hypothetical protein
MMLKGSGFSLISIDGILINVTKYTTKGGSSYIPLPACIERKKATINVQNTDEKCFKYSILAKRVNPIHAERITSNYSEVENIYDFSGLTFPVSLKDVEQFEKKNLGVSINVYGLKRGKLLYKNNGKFKQKFEQTIVYPKKVCEEELEDHHDLLLIGDGMGKKHYYRIINLSKLIGSQILNGHAMCLCKRCLKSYSGLNAQHRLKLHKIKCNKNKLITPILPTTKSIMKFENWNRTQKHPFAIYADFESILRKENDVDECQIHG